jgi:hypothetical protein
MGYQNAPATFFYSREGLPVSWMVSFATKTVTVYIDGKDCGTFRNRTAAIEALGLVEVAAKGAKS